MKGMAAACSLARCGAGLSIAAALLLCTSTLSAQSATLQTDACTSATSINTVSLRPLIERFLTPGKPFSLDGLPPAVMANAMALQKAGIERQAKDWPALCQYRPKNAVILASVVRPRVVFLGDSITEFWQLADPAFFNASVVDRGISGQTTPQILLRFYQDVVSLHPRAVHILAGTNDIAGNTGAASDDMIINNIRAMVDIANANRIKVILASITPVGDANKDRPHARIVALNQRLRALAAERDAIFIDYYAKLLDGGGATISPAATNDGLHPNRLGYALMRPLAERAIAQATH